ncbi:Na(+)/H(+) antiporter subunit B [Magnetospirillum sp. UT-4]|uniref:Na(+)/H(+) antiporter subunit B n=1 Tax=Magnetospirillum sp. UT-4 TaxID=2681467 RepID=UPI00137ED2F8|nr:Na(+)/H(+) antiporter subunit B [Magnetospirillum sp. UT-4]CAA7615314.1 Membrane bound protein complex subunit mbxF [Magnetospirillum sp. UT-4]
MIRRAAALALIAALGALLLPLLLGYHPDEALNLTACYYAERTAADLGAANIVTAIVVTYRGLDTLGEVTVLFLSAAVVGLVLARGRTATTGGRPRLPAGELLTTGSRLLAPLIMLLGIYIFVNGHLTPGGGFQGGAVIASGVLLLLLAEPGRRLGHRVIALVESLSGLAYVAIGVAGLVYAGGFLDNRILPIGTLGELASAGAIPVIYSLIGLKVGAEFSSMLANLSETEEL